jgi:hypothetical protein
MLKDSGVGNVLGTVLKELSLVEQEKRGIFKYTGPDPHHALVRTVMLACYNNQKSYRKSVSQNSLTVEDAFYPGKLSHIAEPAYMVEEPVVLPIDVSLLSEHVLWVIDQIDRFGIEKQDIPDFVRDLYEHEFS